MIDRLARVIRDEVLFADIGDVIALIVFGEQVVEGLLPPRTAVLGDGVIPLLGVGEFGVHVEDHPPEGMFLVTDHLTQGVFGVCLGVRFHD